MNDKIDIHQLDTKRQVLFTLHESGKYLSVAEIKEELVQHRISPDTPSMRSFLVHSLPKNNRGFLRDGLVQKMGSRYRIMQKGAEYLNSTVVIVDPRNGKTNQETVGNILSGLRGNIKLCDPYFDNSAYELLKDNLDSNKIQSVKILYSKNFPEQSAEHKIGKIVVEFCRDNKRLHDRFLLDDNNLYFLGTSLNNIGDKLSFIFNLTIYKGHFNQIFDSYWTSHDL